MEILEKIEMNLIQGRRNEEDEGIDEDLTGPGVTELVRKALEDSISAGVILDVVTRGMETVGEKFESGEFMLPDMLAAAEASSAAMPILEPHLIAENTTNKGRFLLATVKGDLHDIGKNIVGTLLKGAGYEVIDLGIDVPAEEIAETAKQENVDFIGLSALLTTTMNEMKNVVRVLNERKIVAKILVGGAPVDAEFAELIGAHAYGHDGFEAVRIAEQMSSDFGNEHGKERITRRKLSTVKG